jgi:DsbC/DsbD-like thiol-disulfide interchange protein/cytochrome c biogenesis protein CcdA
MRPERGWHGYWENPGDAGFGMSFDWSLPRGATIGPPSYPVPETLLIGGLMNHVYEHDYALLLPFTVPWDAASGTRLRIATEADWLACTEEVCVPERGSLTTSLTVSSAARSDPRFDGWRRRLPAPLADSGRFAASDTRIRLAIPLPRSLELPAPHFFAKSERLIDYAAPQTFRRNGDWLVIDLRRAAQAGGAPPRELAGVLRFGGGDEAQGLAVGAMPGPVPSGGRPLASAAQAAPLSWGGFVAAIGAALVGGLLLNVMPCVFPILGLKALSLASSGAAASRRVRADGLAYTAGAMLACLALGGLMLALRAAGEEVGWAFQLQEPLVVAALLLLAVAITANFAGLFELPALWTGAGERGAFATGLLAAFVATPCTGPFMAAAMGAALVLPEALALAVFAALGLGLALPFLALALVPALRNALPRPGPWMTRFRQAMAVPMVLTAAGLLWLAWRLGGADFAMASGVLAAALIAILVAIGRAQRRGGSALPRAAPALAVLLLIGGVGLPRAAAAPESPAERDLLGSRAFSATALDQARKSGHPVFVYFTADWCLTCKANEAAAIERDSTRAAFDRAGVRVLRGDWTRRDPAITRFLEARGAAGVPLYLWYAPRAAAPRMLPQVLTPGLLADAAASG